MKIPKLKLIERDSWLVSMCENYTVLHLGCTDYPITQSRLGEGRMLHQKLAGVARSIVGVDIDAAGIEQLKASMPDLEFIAYDGEHLRDCVQLANRHFEVVVAADVLEHVPNPGAFLSNAGHFVAPGGKLVLTTPCAFSIKRIAGLGLTGVEQVHHDHTAYYSLATLTKLLDFAGLRILSHFGFQWRNPTVRNRFANTIVYPLVLFSGGRLCDELAITAEPTSR